MTAPRPLAPFSEDLPAALDPDVWMRLLGGSEGFVLFERPLGPDRRGVYLSAQPAPGDLLRWEPPGLDGPPPAPFFGGWAGTLSYDLGRRFERLPALARDEGWPDVAGGFHDWALAVEETDPGRWRNRLVGAVADGAGREALRARARSLARLAEGVAREGPPPREGGDALAGPLRSNRTPAEHGAAVARAVEYVHAGDAFQVNLARRVEGRLRVSPVEAALRLRAANPAPRASVHSAGGGRWVLSSSPELLLEVRDGMAVSEPIKGTRPRTGDPAADAARRADLLGSAKDGAELAMIVDLQRNDLGRVAAVGGVRVVEARRVEEHPTVIHTVARVEARLRRGVGPREVIPAMFPGGSVTGAPKIRAMEIIDELEPVRRGPYTGSSGWWGPDGGAHWNILIRTLVVEGDRVLFSVGGGIVADSDPAEEYRETVDKGRALARALGSPDA